MDKDVTDLRNSDFDIPKRFVKPYIIKEDKIKSENWTNHKQFRIYEKSINFPVFIVNFKHISCLVLVFLLLTLSR